MVLSSKCVLAHQGVHASSALKDLCFRVQGNGHENIQNWL